MASTDGKKYLARACRGKGDLLILNLRAAGIPFGAGKRRCVGEEFALAEMQLVREVWGQRVRIVKADLRERVGLTLWPRRVVAEVRQ